MNVCVFVFLYAQWTAHIYLQFLNAAGGVISSLDSEEWRGSSNWIVRLCCAMLLCLLVLCCLCVVLMCVGE
jgi:hypothetical protein